MATLKQGRQTAIIIIVIALAMAAIDGQTVLAGAGYWSQRVMAGAWPEDNLMNAVLSDQPAQDTTHNISQLTTAYFQAASTGKDPHEQIGIIREILKLDSGSATFWFYLGVQHKLLYEFDLAIRAFEEGLEQYAASSVRPVVQIYEYLGYCYHATGLYKEEMKVYEAGRSHYPDHPALIGRQAICFYALGRIRESDRLLKEYRAYWETEGQKESEILHSQGILFLETDAIKAERFFRAALELDAGNVTYQASLARNLIYMGVRMEEAMEILEKALWNEPENPALLHLTGWGYFRLEEYSLAQIYLVKAEELYPDYNHNLQIHLEKLEEILSVKLFNFQNR